MISDPIFVVGNSRSGTTMVSRILGNHADVFSFRELHLCEELYSTRELGKAFHAGQAERLVAILLSIQREGYHKPRKPDKYREEARRIVAKLEIITPASAFRAFLYYETERNGRRIPCEQTPNYLYYLPELLQHYPNARIINLVRDPRDVLLSQKNKWRRRQLGFKKMPNSEIVRNWTNYHPITISTLWNAAVRTVEKNTSDTRIFTVQFESICKDPARTVKTICERIGISYNDSMLQVPQVGSSTRPNQPQRKGIDSSRASAWTSGGLKPSEIMICERICGETMVRYGYRPSGITQSYHQMIGDVLSFPIKTFGAFALNVTRIRSVSETLRRRFANLGSAASGT